MVALYMALKWIAFVMNEFYFCHIMSISHFHCFDIAAYIVLCFKLFSFSIGVECCCCFFFRSLKSSFFRQFDILICLFVILLVLTLVYIFNACACITHILSQTFKKSWTFSFFSIIPWLLFFPLTNKKKKQIKSLPFINCIHRLPVSVFGFFIKITFNE